MFLFLFLSKENDAVFKQINRYRYFRLVFNVCPRLLHFLTPAYIIKYKH